MEKLDFYINGTWVRPSGVETLDVINPASEEKVTKISLGDATHVNEACLLYTSPSPRDYAASRMPSSA